MSTEHPQNVLFEALLTSTNILRFYGGTGRKLSINFHKIISLTSILETIQKFKEFEFIIPFAFLSFVLIFLHKCISSEDAYMMHVHTSNKFKPYRNLSKVICINFSMKCCIYFLQ